MFSLKYRLNLTLGTCFLKNLRRLFFYPFETTELYNLQPISKPSKKLHACANESGLNNKCHVKRKFKA